MEPDVTTKSVLSVTSIGYKNCVKNLEKDTSKTMMGMNWAIVPVHLQQLYSALPDEATCLPEPQIRRILRREISEENRELVFSSMIRIRVAFWDEYERACIAGEDMKEELIYKEVCAKRAYLHLLTFHKMFIAWIICPLASYMLQRKELEFLAEGRMIDILSYAAVNHETGQVNELMARIQFELYKNVQDRIYGKATQNIKTVSKNLNVNVETAPEGTAAARAIAMITSVEEIDRRIREVKAKRDSLQSGGIQPIQVDTAKLVESVETTNKA